MKLIFFIKSATVNIEKYNRKDILGSTGRLDVISRCILSALIGENGLDENIQIWTFLEKYGTFIFNSNAFDYKDFPKNEILLTDYFVKLIRRNFADYDEENPLSLVKYSNMSTFEAIRQKIKEGFSVYILNEKGVDFSGYKNEILLKTNVVFVIGSQSGELIDSNELYKFDLPNISLGLQSYLASSVIRLIKLNLML